MPFEPEPKLPGERKPHVLQNDVAAHDRVQKEEQWAWVEGRIGEGLLLLGCLAYLWWDRRKRRKLAMKNDLDAT